MDQQRVAEWRELQQSAIETLRRGAAPGLSRQVFQILQLPAFEANLSWELVKCGEEGAGHNRYQAIHLVWQRPTDVAKMGVLERLQHPRVLMPTIETETIELPADFVARTLQHLHGLTLRPYIPEAGIGVDGVGYEFSFGTAFGGARYRWHCAAPPQWQALGDFVNDTLAGLARLK